MDDLSLLSESTHELQALLDRCVKVLTWAGMSFRASKPGSLVIDSGKCVKESLFFVNSRNSCSPEAIPSIHVSPIKFLGRVISESLSDSTEIGLFSETVCNGLLSIDKCHVRGIQKFWILHHLLLPRARWPLLIYEVPLSTVRKLEQKISSYIRKWLRLHHTISSLALYSSISPCPLHLKSFTSVMNAAKISGDLLLRDSSDPVVAGNCPTLKTGKWSVEDAVKVHGNAPTRSFRTRALLKLPILPPKGTIGMSIGDSLATLLKIKKKKMVWLEQLKLGQMV